MWSSSISRPCASAARISSPSPPSSSRSSPRAAPGSPPPSSDCLAAYSWPGNVRELRNAMERAALLSRGELILPEHLPARVSAAQFRPRRRLRPPRRYHPPRSHRTPGHPRHPASNQLQSHRNRQSPRHQPPRAPLQNPALPRTRLRLAAGTFTRTFEIDLDRPLPGPRIRRMADHSLLGAAAGSCVGIEIGGTKLQIVSGNPDGCHPRPDTVSRWTAPRAAPASAHQIAQCLADLRAQLQSAPSASGSVVRWIAIPARSVVRIRSRVGRSSHCASGWNRSPQPRSRSRTTPTPRHWAKPNAGRAWAMTPPST
jgi:hypothetical protein